MQQWATLIACQMSSRVVSYAVEQRLRFIELLLTDYGFFTRKTVVAFFGVSMASVSRDVELYQELAPGNVVYNGRTKAFQKMTGFVGIYEQR